MISTTVYTFFVCVFAEKLQTQKNSLNEKLHNMKYLLTNPLSFCHGTTRQKSFDFDKLIRLHFY